MNIIINNAELVFYIMTNDYSIIRGDFYSPMQEIARVTLFLDGKRCKNAQNTFAGRLNDSVIGEVCVARNKTLFFPYLFISCQFEFGIPLPEELKVYIGEVKSHPSIVLSIPQGEVQYHLNIPLVTPDYRLVGFGDVLQLIVDQQTFLVHIRVD